jgi:hypothetical protein
MRQEPMGEKERRGRGKGEERRRKDVLVHLVRRPESSMRQHTRLPAIRKHFLTAPTTDSARPNRFSSVHLLDEKKSKKNAPLRPSTASTVAAPHVTSFAVSAEDLDGCSNGFTRADEGESAGGEVATADVAC